MAAIELPENTKRIYLYAEGECETYSFYYGLKEGEKKSIFKGADAAVAG